MLEGKIKRFSSETTVEQENSDNPLAYGALLAIIRRRRWYLWGLILFYMPVSVTTLQLTQSYKSTGILLLFWFILLCIVVTLTAISKCPKCGNSFHMRNSGLSYFRKCCHCGLHLCADKQIKWRHRIFCISNPVPRQLKIKMWLSICYFEHEKLSTKTVDNPVDAVDMFRKCHIESSVLSVCILNKQDM
jgi:hypothetical protein